MKLIIKTQEKFNGATRYQANFTTKKEAKRYMLENHLTFLPLCYRSLDIHENDILKIYSIDEEGTFLTDKEIKKFYYFINFYK